MSRYFSGERHHILWEKRNYTTPLEKRVRGMASFIIDVTRPHHRLLHASMAPPEKPSPDVLREMEGLAVNGLEVVINKINHPIAQHIQSQIEIISMPVDEALERLDTGEYWVGYGSRRKAVNPEHVSKIVNVVQQRVAEELGRLAYKFDQQAFEDAAFYQLEDLVERGLISRDEATAALIEYSATYFPIDS